MSTDVPPHNLNEVASALVHLIDNPKATVAAVMKHIKGPDFPTGGELVSPRADIKDIYTKGGGTLRLRASYKIEDGDIVIDSLPLPGLGQQSARADRDADARQEVAAR